MKTDGQISSHRPSPVHRSWSIHTFIDEPSATQSVTSLYRSGPKTTTVHGAWRPPRVASWSSLTSRPTRSRRPAASDDAPRADDSRPGASRIEALEEQLLETRGQLAQTRSNNEKLTITIQQTRDQIAALRDEVEKLTQPPAVYGTFVDFNADGTVDVFASGRKMRVALHPDLDPGQVDRGDEVVLNESFTVIGVRDPDAPGRGRDASRRSWTTAGSSSTGAADEERVVEIVRRARAT